jgi:hypothetical protein|tara:strand:- start:99 stop:308 length:210 start_codon:yes stop_codon:yes gene_type:complete
MNITINGKPVSFKASMMRAKQSSFVGASAADKFYQANSTDVVANAALAVKATVNTARASYNAIASTVKK